MRLPIRTTIVVNGEEWDFERDIHTAALTDGTVIVTFFPREGLPSIVALDMDRRTLWRDIDLPHFPRQEDHLTMYSISGEEPLSFYISEGYLLEVEAKTGELLDMRFVK
jgi:hypothetical protein